VGSNSLQIDDADNWRLRSSFELWKVEGGIWGLLRESEERYSIYTPCQVRGVAEASVNHTKLVAMLLS
jgi:hypothetical protein